VDSEHSAVFQCIQKISDRSDRSDRSDGSLKNISRLTLTASGGPFFNKPLANFETVSIAETLAHPKWRMGQKISVDSATMMNKGLELIEARWLFDLPPERLDVVVHPESIVHALVEFADGATLAQLSPPDMRVAIQYALSWPDRWPAARERLDLAQLRSLNFFAPDETRFPCLALARAALKAGGLMPTVLNAANEIAVEGFLAGKIPLASVPRLIERAMEGAESGAPNLQAVIETDARTRARVAEFIESNRLSSTKIDSSRLQSIRVDSSRQFKKENS